MVRQFSPSIGGLEEAVAKLGGALQARGCDIRVVTLDRIAKEGPERLPTRSTVDGLAVHRIPFRGSWRYPVAPRVLHEIADVDLVHVHGIDFFFDFLALTCALHGKPLVASTHGGFFHTSFARRAKQVYFASMTRASALAYRAICASSQSDYELFRPIAARQLVLAPNGVDIDKWSGLGSTQPLRRLLYVGRFSSNKNLAALFPLLRELRRLHPAWSLTVAGRPWDVTVTDLRTDAAGADVAEAVTILESPSDAIIAAAIGSSSYVVSASRHEGFGISIVEGLSAGLVPVLSRIPPFETLVRDGGVGLTLDFADTSAAATAIEMQHQALMREPRGLREAAMRAARPYSWATSTDVVQRAYDIALQGGRTRGLERPLRMTP